jgi:hypothetical protein
MFMGLTIDKIPVFSVDKIDDIMGENPYKVNLNPRLLA